MVKRALITGVTGQDGAYLARELLAEGYMVTGTTRGFGKTTNWRLQHLGIADKVHIRQMEMTDFTSIMRTIGIVEPDIIFNLAALSFASDPSLCPFYTTDVEALGAVRIMEAAMTVDSGIKIFQPGSSEMYGADGRFNEAAPFRPKNFYGMSKVFAHYAAKRYRSDGMFISNAVMFNHESPLRDRHFVTQKIVEGFAFIASDKWDKKFVLQLGNLDVEKDWGHASDYAQGMRLIMEHDTADDFVMATGRSHSIREFVNAVAEYFNIPVDWVGKGAEEQGFNKVTGEMLVQVNPNYIRRDEIKFCTGEPAKMRSRLGWSATTSLGEIITEMCRFEELNLQKPIGTYK